MKVYDLEALENQLSRTGYLDSANKDLIENAIWCLRNGYEYRAESALKGLAANLRNSGHRDAAQMVERLL